MNKDKKWLLREFRKLTFELQNGYAKVKAVDILPLIDQLDEPKKVVIPQFVADHIRFSKDDTSPRNSMGEVHVSKELNVWLAKTEDYMTYPNQEKFMRAWLDGYEIERKPLYYVKLPNTNSENEHLYLAQGSASGGRWFNSKLELIEYDTNTCQHQFTEAEIKSIDSRYWQFAQPVEEEKE